ncbi:acyl-CoA thioester hydrolase YbgC [mine drainage metagenome]|uniref:Acyl-CoA thioester hydrolase YbgC n=1 Tax=mine drainage metagenome TaxID=410659 RepID=A0A1J5RFZ0_9ZZZZ
MTELSGRWDGVAHLLPLRVYYADTDAGGVVYHATYLAFAERARTEMTRLMGLDQVRLRAEKGLLFAVRSCEIDFLRPARLDDPLTVRSALTHLGGASMHVLQTISRGEEELVRLVVRLVCMTETAKAARIPDDLRARFQAYLTQGTE